MSREELIGYCELHCRTPRALFRFDQIAQMVEYAGRPDNCDTPEEFMERKNDFTSLKSEMEELIKLSRETTT